MKRKHGFYYEYTPSRFFDVNLSSKLKLWVNTKYMSKYMGYVESYVCTPESKVKFGPLIEVAISPKRLTFNGFVEEFKSQLERLYSTPQVFQLGQECSRISRKF